MSVIAKEDVKKLVNSISSKHEKKSYRRIAKEDYPSIIKAGTLCRIAKSEGKWLPKDRDILIALGLIKVIHKPAFIIQWNHLPTEERQKVIQQYILYRTKQKTP